MVAAAFDAGGAPVLWAGVSAQSTGHELFGYSQRTAMLGSVPTDAEPTTAPRSLIAVASL